MSESKKYYVYSVGVNKNDEQVMATAYMFVNGSINEQVIDSWQSKFKEWNRHWNSSLISFWCEISEE